MGVARHAQTDALQAADRDQAFDDITRQTAGILIDGKAKSQISP